MNEDRNGLVRAAHEEVDPFGGIQILAAAVVADLHANPAGGHGAHGGSAAMPPLPAEAGQEMGIHGDHRWLSVIGRVDRVPGGVVTTRVHGAALLAGALLVA